MQRNPEERKRRFAMDRKIGTQIKNKDIFIYKEGAEEIQGRQAHWRQGNYYETYTPY